MENILKDLRLIKPKSDNGKRKNQIELSYLLTTNIEIPFAEESKTWIFNDEELKDVNWKIHGQF